MDDSKTNKIDKFDSIIEKFIKKDQVEKIDDEIDNKSINISKSIDKPVFKVQSKKLSTSYSNVKNLTKSLIDRECNNELITKNKVVILDKDRPGNGLWCYQLDENTKKKSGVLDEVHEDQSNLSCLNCKPLLEFKQKIIDLLKINLNNLIRTAHKTIVEKNDLEFQQRKMLNDIEHKSIEAREREDFCNEVMSILGVLEEKISEYQKICYDFKQTIELKNNSIDDLNNQISNLKSIISKQNDEIKQRIIHIRDMKELHKSDKENLRKTLENKIEIYKNKYNKDVISQKKFNGHEEYKNSLNSKDLLLKLEIEKLKEKNLNLEKDKVKLNEILESKNEKIKEMTTVVKDYDIITKRLHNECVYQKRSFDFKHIENRLLKTKLENDVNAKKTDLKKSTSQKINNFSKNENEIHLVDISKNLEKNVNGKSYINKENNNKIAELSNFINISIINNTINKELIVNNSKSNKSYINFSDEKQNNINNMEGSSIINSNDRINNVMKNLLKNKENKPYFVTEDMVKK